jgi:hypothetical protein
MVLLACERMRQRRPFVTALLVGLIVCATLAAAGCGGGNAQGGGGASSPPVGTQAGNYVLTITATSGTITHTTTVSLTVQ